MGKLQLELSALKQQYSDALGQLAASADVRAQLDALMQKNVELQQQNDELMTSEKQTSVVVKQLMQDLEGMKKGGLIGVVRKMGVSSEDKRDA